MGRAVPDVHAARRGANAQRGGVPVGARPAAQGGQDTEGVETVRKSVQVDLVADRDAGQDPVAGGRLGNVCVDVDHDQAGRAAGDTGPEVRVGRPPLCDSLLVQGRCVEAVAPATGGQACALGGSVAVIAPATL